MLKENNKCQKGRDGPREIKSKKVEINKKI